jgi:hypothetical protein
MVKMKKVLFGFLAALAIGMTATESAAAKNVTTATPGVVSIQHYSKGDIIHWKDWASYAKANGLAVTARKSDNYLDCSGPVPPNSECNNINYNPGSSTYFHLGNAQWFLGYAADWCGQWYCRTSGLASNYFGTTFNNRLAGNLSSYRNSNNVVTPYVNWYQWGLRKFCWFGTTVVGNDISASTPYALSYACGTY